MREHYENQAFVASFLLFSFFIVHKIKLQPQIHPPIIPRLVFFITKTADPTMNTFHTTTLIVLISMLLAALMSENIAVTATLTTASQASKTEAAASSLEDEVNEIDLLDFLDVWARVLGNL